MKAGSRKAHHHHKQPNSSRASDNSAEFHTTLSAQYLQRYAELFQALAAPVQHVALLNGFTTVNDCDELGMTDKVCQDGPVICLRSPGDHQSTSHHHYPPPPSCPYTQLKQFYYMDLASVLPPLLLGVQPHHAVLDMCGGKSPGGKSLVLAMQLLLGTQQQQEQQQGQQQEDEQESHAAAGGQALGGGLSADLLQRLQLDDQAAHTQPAEQQSPAAAAAAEAEAEAASGSMQQQQSHAPPDHSNAANGADAAAGNNSSAAASEDGDDTAAPAPPPAAASGVSSNSSSAGRLVCNEVDPVRRSRLSSVITSHIPGSLRRRVRVTGHDAAKHWARFEGCLYDRVLLDAPCSCERHVVQGALEAGGVVSSSVWSREQCSNLAALQLKLLLAGVRALKTGGRLVYSTSSVVAAENDDVVEAALLSWQQQQQQSPGGGSRIKVVAPADWGLDQSILQGAGAEPTQHGMICLPDRAGWGPVYLCLLEKSV